MASELEECFDEWEEYCQAFLERWNDPDKRPLPDPTKWWGIFNEEVVDVDPRYL